jgi:hypothetical protein
MGAVRMMNRCFGARPVIDLIPKSITISVDSDIQQDCHAAKDKSEAIEIVVIAIA